MTAIYTFDHADRQSTFTLTEAGGPPFPLVSSASYEPFGPLLSLSLGNGLMETRTYGQRYQPLGIQVSGASPLLDWSYTVDPVGNITAIQDVLVPANSRTYGYQDFHYFLTQGDGPWGPRSWTYDRIGNRLTETRGPVTETYSYLGNAGGGRNPKLLSVAAGGGGTRSYSYDQVGNTIQIVDDEQQLDLIPDAAGRMAFLRSLPEETFTAFRYDGRSYLREASEDDTGCLSRKTLATYSSEGLLHRREHRLIADDTLLEGNSVLYFAGRPVAILEQGDAQSILTFLSTDHLGTPVLATNESGGVVWQGGFEPFGKDWNGASVAGVFLRLPGQWEDAVWGNGEVGGFYYNLHRWYEPGRGRYSQPEPVRLLDSVTHYLYAGAQPVRLVDAMGLQSGQPLGIPTGAVFCWELGNEDQGCCDTPRLGEAIANVARREAIYCANKDKPGLPSENLPQDGGALPAPWFRPQGNPCVDRCICAHEEFHVWQVRSPVRAGWSTNALECEAYKVHRRCLSEARRNSRPWNEPWIGALPIP